MIQRCHSIGYFVLDILVRRVYQAMQRHKEDSLASEALRKGLRITCSRPKIINSAEFSRGEHETSSSAYTGSSSTLSGILDASLDTKVIELGCVDIFMEVLQ